jgi:hypothetical protein
MQSGPATTPTTAAGGIALPSKGLALESTFLLSCRDHGGSESHKRWVMRKPYVKLSVSGMGSGALYALLYAYEEEVMFAFTRTDGWYPLLPVLGAFVVSFVHGAFAAYFWEVLGITARREKT